MIESSDALAKALARKLLKRPHSSTQASSSLILRISGGEETCLITTTEVAKLGEENHDQENEVILPEQRDEEQNKV